MVNDGSTIRLRPMYKNHVWSYDFVHERTSDGRAIRILNNNRRIHKGMFSNTCRTKGRIVGSFI